MSALKTRSRLISLSLLLISAIVSLSVLELVLRFIAPHNMYHSLVPSIDVDKQQEYAVFFPGIDSISHFSVNEYGYRSPGYFSKNRYGILAIGGSTTQCIGLSDHETWPWLLENMLNDSSSAKDFTVGNIGVPGFNAGNNFYQLMHIEPQFDNIKTVLLLVGINDFIRVLRLNDNFYPTSEDEHLHNRSFLRLPRKENAQLHKRTELYLHARDMYNQYKSNNEAPSTLGWLYSLLEDYSAAIKADSLPDLTIALEDYEKNLKSIAKLSRQRGLRLVLITQPVLWNKDISIYEEKVGSIGAPVIDGITYSPVALERGMKIFNDRLKKVAEEEQVDVIDLAKKLPQDTSIFYDHCHFNIQGAANVAQIIHKDLQTILHKEVSSDQNQ